MAPNLRWNRASVSKKQLHHIFRQRTRKMNLQRRFQTYTEFMLAQGLHLQTQEVYTTELISRLSSLHINFLLLGRIRIHLKGVPYLMFTLISHVWVVKKCSCTSLSQRTSEAASGRQFSNKYATAHLFIHVTPVNPTLKQSLYFSSYRGAKRHGVIIR